MKHPVSSTKRRCGVWLTIFFTFALAFSGQAQSYKWSIGSAITHYQFQNSKGLAIEWMKPSAGLHVELSHENALIDTVRLISKFSKSALFFNNHPKLAKTLSHLNYAIGLNYHQLNAIGDVRQIAFSYQTDFVGFSASLGPKYTIYRGWALGLSGVMMGQQLIAGNQLLGQRYFPLTEDTQFNTFKVFGGYQAEISKSVNANVRAFVLIRRTASLFSPQTPTGTLDFLPTTISMGISIKR